MEPRTEGPAAPEGQPSTSEDQRGENQPADAGAVDSAGEAAAAVEDPDAGQ